MLFGNLNEKHFIPMQITREPFYKVLKAVIELWCVVSFSGDISLRLKVSSFKRFTFRQTQPYSFLFGGSVKHLLRVSLGVSEESGVKIGRLWSLIRSPAPCSLHIEVSLSRILNPNLLHWCTVGGLCE